MAESRNERISRFNVAGESVILVHGMVAHRSLMWPMARYLRRHGYQVTNWGYPSIRGAIEECGEGLRAELKRLASCPEISQIHLIGHSMGGIVVRCALQGQSFSKLGRIVMLVTPNSGSHAARRLAPPLGWLCPYLRELSDSSDSFVSQLPPLEGLEIGAVASRIDHVVSLGSALAVSATDHMLINVWHGLVPCSPVVSREARQFLQTGRFSDGVRRAEAVDVAKANSEAAGATSTRE